MKLSPNFKASLYAIAFILYLVFAILGFEKAKADTLDDMTMYSECLASMEIARLVTEQSNQPAVAEVFNKMKNRWTLAWPWEGELFEQFVSAAYNKFRDALQSGEMEIEFVFNYAKNCVITMEK